MTTGQQKRYFEFQDAKSAKFWEVTTEGMSVTVRYGKIGTAGQSQEKTFENIDSAQRHVVKLISEKVKKGYVRQNPDGNISGKSLQSGVVPIGESTGRIDAPAEFEELRALFIEICKLLANEPTENENINRVRNEFIADFDNTFKSGAWSWAPVTIQVEDQKVDRLGEVVMGPIFTSEDHAWPEQDGLPMAPLIQLDLRIASEIGGVQLGDGLLQVWMPKYSFETPVYIRIIPRDGLHNSSRACS